MGSFPKKLDELLRAAREQGILDEAASSRLLALAQEKDRGRTVVSLATVLGWMGGGATALGVILLVSANWESIPDLAKIAGFLALFSAVNGAGLWIRWSGRPFEKTAEALNFLGAGLFLGGVGLVAQVFHLSSRPSNGILVWLVAIAPLAWLLRSAPITLLSIFAVLLWGHMEGEQEGSALKMARYGSFTSHMMLELGLGAALVGFSGLLREREPIIARVFRATGALLLFATLYALTFFRHFSNLEDDSGSAALPVAALLLGVLGLAAGGKGLVPGMPWLRNRLLIFLGLVLLLAACALLADRGFIPRGDRLEFFDFGRASHLDAVEWIVSAAAWVLWFLLALWCVGFGARAGRKAYLNAGVGGFGLGVMTLFFDLMGTLAFSGALFLLGGVVLLGTGWAMERWRRRLIARMAGAEMDRAGMEAAGTEGANTERKS